MGSDSIIYLEDYNEITVIFTITFGNINKKNIS
jgi:hypothetical protein